MSIDNNAVLSLMAASAAATAAALAFAQTDFVARKILDSQRLDAKRRSEYNYRWKTAVEKAYLQINYALAGGVSAAHNNPGLVDKQIELISDPNEMEQFAKDVVANDSQIRCLKIDRDNQDSQGGFYLFLIDWQTKHLFQLPLMSFGIVLAKAFEKEGTTNTFCFVADTSSGKGSSLLKDLVIASKSGVAVVSEPLWMIQLARLVQANLYPSEQIEQLFFGLCQLEAWFVRDQCIESKTLMINLPGQATTSSLLPLAQKCFPNDRHVFVFDDCQSSVRRGMHLLQKSDRRSRGKVERNLESILYGMCQDPIPHTVPLPSTSPLTYKVENLVDSMGQLPLAQAQVMEIWMGSIDSLLNLKAKEKGYTPLILKLSSMIDGDRSYEDGCNAYEAMVRLLRLIAGPQISDGMKDSAREFMKDYCNKKKEVLHSGFSQKVAKTMKQCVSHQKQAFAGNESLSDTIHLVLGDT